ncbi:MAG: hypothetical protein KKG33_10450 [candidate division Zixibacteria bacterium]|nr:hypothetical protein [candidate division Zixibacteria bacterium]MBU1469154.1 hypothetical protein [candidate division Zixibacteria bacterium]MBU2625967.1 hypothetical protein [candidate division Zixibacteria bacterium]
MDKYDTLLLDWADSSKIDEAECGKVVQVFGSWIVTEEGLVYGGSPHVEYFIEASRLWEVRPRTRQWDWLLHMDEKAWMSDADVYCLNTAFFFALDFFRAKQPRDFQGADTVGTLSLQAIGLLNRRPGAGGEIGKKLDNAVKRLSSYERDDDKEPRER